MRFTNSLTSFKSGRLSPKLFNRIDTKQYKDGASVMEGFRVLSEGGAERVKGTRYVNVPFWINGSGTTREVPININGKQKILFLSTTLINTVFTIAEYPYNHADVSASPLTELSGLIGLDLDMWDWAVVDNNVIFTHFSGRVPPTVVRFNDDGSFNDVKFYYQLIDIVSALPMSDAENRYKIDLSNENTALHTISLTSTDPDAVALLQSSVTIFLEGLGSRDFGAGVSANFVASNFYIVTGNLANGVTTQYVSGYETGGFGGGIDTETLTFGGIAQASIIRTNIWKNDNWPKTVTSHEARAVYGGCPSKPLTLFGSKTSNEFYMNNVKFSESGIPEMAAPNPSGNINPTDPYIFKISSKECSEITFVRTANELVVGTDRKEYIASGGDTGLSALSVSIGPRSTKGSYPLASANMDNAIAYISSSRKKLYMFRYSSDNGSHVSVELSLLFSDLLDDDTIKEVEWAAHVNVLYILMNSGKLYGITYDPQADTIAFFDTTITNISSVSYVASREDESTADTFHRGDHVLLMERVGTSTYRLLSYEDTYLELGVAESGIKEAKANRNAYAYWEGAFRIDRNAANDYNIHGENKLPVADNFPIPIFADLPVPFQAYNVDTEEVITITTKTATEPAWYSIDDPAINGASAIIVGNLPTPKILGTMPVEAGQQFGSAQMGIKNIDELGIRHYKSYSYEISSDKINWQEVRVADKSGNITTGRETKKFSSSPKYDQIVYIRSTKPEPLTIIGINMRGVSNDG